MAWDVDFAKELKKRNNVDIDESITGTVISTDPISIGIFNNQFILTSNLIHISNSLSILTGTCMVDGKLGTCEIDRTLKFGDKVLCVPTAKGQKWFIVEVVDE